MACILWDQRQQCDSTNHSEPSAEQKHGGMSDLVPKPPRWAPEAALRHAAMNARLMALFQRGQPQIQANDRRENRRVTVP
jgi:hypothetical protein